MKTLANTRYLIACATLMLTACQKPITTQDATHVRPVQTIIAGDLAPTQSGVSFAAEIKPRTEARMAFRVSGKITQRFVDIGATVTAGQALMQLDATDLQLQANASPAQVAAAKANLDLAQADLKRTEQLAQNGFVSSGRVDQAASQAKAAQASLDAAQAGNALQSNATQYGVLRADTAGVITAIDAEVGQVVAAGTPIVKVAQGSDKDVVFSVPEAMVKDIKPLLHKAISVQLWSQANVVYTATVKDIAAIADPATRTFMIKARLADPKNNVPLGASATVVLPKINATISGTQSKPLTIPLTALTDHQGQAAVWVVEAGAAQKKTVTLGNSHGDTVDILQGLTAGSTVITAGVHTLTQGQKVRLLTAVEIGAENTGASNRTPAAEVKR